MSGPSDIQGGDILLTVFLKHDQSKTLGEFQTALDARDWWRRFPPEGVEIVSWTVAMGLGQIVTLRLPPDRLQAVNVELERSAWGRVPHRDFRLLRFPEGARPAHPGIGGAARRRPCS